MSAAASHRAKSTAATLAQVKALADPLRYRVFENLLAEPRTAKQMAEHLGTHPTRLYHHFRVLERAGLIRPAGTRQTRGTTEKYFKAAVDRLDMTSRSTGGATLLAAAMLEGVLGSTLADLQRAGTRSGGRREALGIACVREALPHSRDADGSGGDSRASRGARRNVRGRIRA